MKSLLRMCYTNTKKKSILYNNKLENIPGSTKKIHEPCWLITVVKDVSQSVLGMKSTMIDYYKS